MADAAYDGIFGYGFSWLFTPTTGTPFGSTQAQVEEANTPPVTIETAKYTPISGANSNVEQFALGRYPVKEYKMKVTYSASSHAAALTCLAARVKGSLVCTYGDGSSETYAGSALTEVSSGPNTAAGLRTAEITVTTPVPPVFSAGTTVTVVQTTQALSTGTATIDLTASPYSGGVKTPIRMFLMNPSANANTITIAKGGTNGYAGFGSSFSITLSPGESCQLDGASALSGSNKTLDLTGTGSQTLVVQVQLQ
jgi:hypothetical protein